MNFKDDKIHYSRNYKLALIVSLTLTIICFLFFPDINNRIDEDPIFYEPIITLMDIPQTSNSQNSASFPPEPIAIETSNTIEAEELILLEDIDIKENTLNENTGDNSYNKTHSDNKEVYEFSSLPFIPRQVLEVVPKEIEGAKGKIFISLRIGKDGYVKEHKIIEDNSNKTECLKNIIKAVYKSRWQPIIIEDKLVEYWVEKIYSFN